MSDEEYVRSRWEFVHSYKDDEFDPPIFSICVQLEEGSESSWIMASGPTLDVAWEVAYGATLEREREIEQRKTDWAMLAGFINSEGGTYQRDIFKRLYVREQAALNDLRKGMKP